MQYELLYILSASIADDDIGKAEATIKQLIEKQGASVADTKRLGKFRFAYPIKKARHGHYILVQIQAEPSQVAKIDEALRLSHDVLRHLLLRADEAGGESFELVQFTEVSVDAKDDLQRRRRERPEGTAPVAEAAKPAEEVKPEAARPPLSDEELDKKLTAALEGDVQEA